MFTSLPIYHRTNHLSMMAAQAYAISISLYEYTILYAMVV